MLSREATNTNFIVFGLARPGPQTKIYRTRGEHANHYATDAVDTSLAIGDISRRWNKTSSYIYTKGFFRALHHDLMYTETHTETCIISNNFKCISNLPNTVIWQQLTTTYMNTNVIPSITDGSLILYTKSQCRSNMSELFNSFYAQLCSKSVK